MSPEALTLAKSRLELEVRDAACLFPYTVARATGSMNRASSAYVQKVLELSRDELERRGRRAWDICRRILDADDAGPTEATRTQLIELVRQRVGDKSEDLELLYSQAAKHMPGSWPSLANARVRAVELATFDIDVEFLQRRRRVAPLADVLRSPRYASVLLHWTRALAHAGESPSDPTSAIRQAILALESLAKIVCGAREATLGDAVKRLRANKVLDPGVDDILEGVWKLANAMPGLRHGGTTAPNMTDADWQALKPMIEGALALLVGADVVS